MLTMAQRDECREVQDQLLEVARRRGIADWDAVLWNAPRITLREMQTTIYPAQLPEFKRILRECGPHAA